MGEITLHNELIILQVELYKEEEEWLKVNKLS